MTGDRQVRVNGEVLSGTLLLALAAVALWGARGAGPSVWLFPRLTASVMAVAALLLLLEGFRKREVTVLWHSWREGLAVLGVAAATMAYALTLRWLGFWLATALLVGGAAYLLQPGRERVTLGRWLALGLAVGLGFDILFVGVFGVPLPGGILWGGAPWRPWLP